MRELVSGIDILIVVLLLFVIYLIAHKIQTDNIDQYAHYSHFKRALFIRIAGGLLFACVYIFYYDGGDTQYYFTGTRSIVRMAYKDFGAFLQLIFGNREPELLSLFDYTTGWPTYFKDANSWAVCRFSVPFYILGMGSYLGMTIVMDALLFIPIWRFYKMIVKHYPKTARYAAIALFYVPSVCFWGSGLLKDIWCMVGALGICYSCWMIVLRKKKIFINIFRCIIWGYVLISIRPYTLYTVLGTSIAWIGMTYLEAFENKFLRALVFPFMIAIIAGIFFIFLDNVSGLAEGKYATVNSMMEQAVIIQDDLKRDYYGDNSFDIGTFDASIPGMLKKLPPALFAGLYRPFLWEARSPFMLLSALENLALMLLTLFLLFKLRMRFFSELLKDKMLLSFLMFTLAFGFFIGLTIANFGALVRYRIILVPFFVIVLTRLFYIYKKSLEEEE